MTLKHTDKQELDTVVKPAENGLENTYSDLPLFGYGISDTLHLPMNKVCKENGKDRIASTPPSPLKSQAGPAKSAKSKISKATPVISKPAPQTQRSVQTENDSVLLTVPDLCKLLKVSRSTLIRIEKAGKLPGRVVLGGSVRYHRETIDAWLHDLAANVP